MTEPANPEPSSHPKRAPLAFRVGVVGHRPNRLQHTNLDELREVLGVVLDAVKSAAISAGTVSSEYFSNAEPALRALSPLAEGTDRIFAEVAFDRGFDLCCVTPFLRQEYERDFVAPDALEEGSLDRFQTILNRAKTKLRLTLFELVGNRTPADLSYGAAGRVVLNQSDLLVVVWDGRREGKRGGTEQTLDEALRAGVPIVWIDAHEPRRWQLLVPGNPVPGSPAGERAAPFEQGKPERISELVSELILPPGATRPANAHARREDRPASDPAELRDLETFYGEWKPDWSFAQVWHVFERIFGRHRLPEPRFRIQPFEEAVLDKWPKQSPEGESPAIGESVNLLRPYYAWLDKLSVLYADRYRSTFIVSFLAAALAVMLALLPIAFAFQSHGVEEAITISLELVAILTIVVLVTVARRRRWHERWLDYRLGAELVRHLRIVAPLAGGRPFPQAPAHWGPDGQIGATWMAWYVRAVERELGLPNTVVDKQYLLSSLRHLKEYLSGVNGQLDYHQKNTIRAHRIERALHRFGLATLAGTLVAGTLHLMPALGFDFELLHGLRPAFLVFLCGFLPAAGAAAAGIANQGEFRRVQKRSHAMAQRINNLDADIDKLIKKISADADPHGAALYLETVELARESARVLVNEVLDWRVVFLDQPPKYGS